MVCNANTIADNIDHRALVAKGSVVFLAGDVPADPSPNKLSAIYL